MLSWLMIFLQDKTSEAADLNEDNALMRPEVWDGVLSEYYCNLCQLINCD